MALKPLTPTVTTPTTPPQCSLCPYKRAKSTPGPHRPFPPLSRAPSFLLCPRAELKPPPFFASVAPPLHRRSCSDERPSATASSGSSSSTATGEHQRVLALTRCVPARPHHTFLSAPPQSMVDPSRAARFTRRGPDPPDFPLENKFEKSIIPYHFAFWPLSFLKILPRSLCVWKYYHRTLISEKYL
jgi:hypothetical protein